MYSDDDEFVASVSEFIDEGLSANEPTLAVLDVIKIDRLRAALGPSADRVRFADMGEVGSNPARILATWQEFVGGYDIDTRLRGVGEPVSPGRTPPELVECQLHESLLNIAFDGDANMHLVCPYDARRLDDQVLANARRSHPYVEQAGCDGANTEYYGAEATRIFSESLPRPSVTPAELRFSSGPLHHFRRFVEQHAADAGLSASRLDDAVLAANELASNSLVHGGGSGLARAWSDNDMFICEVHDSGYIEDPLAGRLRPSIDDTEGRGMWMANQLCDLLQVRSSKQGTVVRLHLRVLDTA